jgi:ribosome-associated translation inhibitor RaiA
MEEGEQFYLCGFEPLQDFGLALPLFKSSPHANAWYVQVAEKPYDLGSRIRGFEIFHPETPSILDQSCAVSEGQASLSVFLWDGRMYAGTIAAILRDLEDQFETLAKYAPISLTDLLLFSGSHHFPRGVRRCYRYLRSKFDGAAAQEWFQLILMRQTSRLDFDRILATVLSDLAPNEKDELINAVCGMRCRPVGPKEAAIVYADAIDKIVDMSQLSMGAFKYTLAACNAVGARFELRTTSGRNTTPSQSAPVQERVVDESAESVRPRPTRKLVRSVAGGISVDISGQGVDVGEALQATVRTSIATAFLKLGMADGKAHVTFSRGPYEVSFLCLLNVTGGGVTVSAKAPARDIYGAFTGALERARSQLRRSMGQRRFDRRRALNSKYALRDVSPSDDPEEPLED